MNGLDRWIERLGYDKVPGALIASPDTSSTDYPFASEVEAMFQSEEVGASSVLCIDRVPTVCLVDSARLSDAGQARSVQIRKFCERLWNQNLARIVLVTSENHLEAWSVDDPRANHETILATDTDAISDFSFQGLLNGKVLKSRASWFDPHKRVDKTLLENLGVLVEKLARTVNANKAREITSSIIFVAYLEDRGIVTEAYRVKRRVSRLIQLLEQADVVGIDRLFAQLQKDFNGDFLADDGRKPSMWHGLPQHIFEDLHAFLQRTVLRSGQSDFWRYDFAQIPIELISGIYETFLGQKAEAEILNGNGSSSKRKRGAYYTPRLLSEWVVDQAFEGLDPLKQRIFDGACGSGMLLTAAFRRLMRAQRSATRAKVHNKEISDFGQRCDLLLGHIYGSDIDVDARRLTVFSLYLALLSDLTPRDLELLHRGGHRLPSLKENIRSQGGGDFFKKESETLNKGQYTIFISNPPWRQMPPNAPESRVIDAWVKRQSKPVSWPKRQIAAAFALAAADSLVPYGRVAMILPIGLFISAEPSVRRFRANLLSHYKVDRVTNFADMRHLIFVDADHPFVVMIATHRSEAPSDISGEQFEYWTPKTDISLSLGRLTLHGADRAIMESAALLDQTPHLSLRYWGTLQDLAILERLWQHGSISNLRANHGWEKGKGFHRVDNDRRVKKELRSVRPSRWLRTHKFMKAKYIPGDLPVVDEQLLVNFPYDEIARENEELSRFFEGPRVIWPDGTHPENGVKAVFADAPFSFQHSIGVLSAPATEIGRLEARFLTAYMRSHLGIWLSLLLSPSVAAERPKLHVKELLSWPYWPAEKHPHPSKAQEILKRVDKLFSGVENAGSLEKRQKYSGCKAELEELVFDYFELRPDERVVIRELAIYGGTSLQPSSLSYNSLVKSVRKPPSREDIDRYCRRLLSVLIEWRDVTGGTGELDASPWTARSLPLGGVVVTLSRTGCRNSHAPRVEDDGVISELLTTAAKAINGTPEQYLTFPDVIAVSGNHITIVKPLVARFWLERAAVEDASKLVTEINAVRGAKALA